MSLANQQFNKVFQEYNQRLYAETQPSDQEELAYLEEMNRLAGQHMRRFPHKPLQTYFDKATFVHAVQENLGQTLAEAGLDHLLSVEMKKELGKEENMSIAKVVGAGVVNWITQRTVYRGHDASNIDEANRSLKGTGIRIRVSDQ